LRLPGGCRKRVNKVPGRTEARAAVNGRGNIPCFQEEGSNLMGTEHNSKQWLRGRDAAAGGVHPNQISLGPPPTDRIDKAETGGLPEKG